MAKKTTAFSNKRVTHEKRSVNLPTCRATPTEAQKFRAQIEPHAFTGPSHFFRHCLEKWFAMIEAGEEPELPLDFVRKKTPAAKPKKPKRRHVVKK
jgi:hypothetical protein